MKTLLLASSFPPRLGGLETYLGELAGVLAASDLHVVAASTPDAGAFDGSVAYRVHRFEKTVDGIGYVDAWRLLARRLGRVDGHSGWGASARTTALLAANRNMLRNATAQLSALSGLDTPLRPELVHVGVALPGGVVARLLRERAGVPYIVYTHAAELLRWGAESRLGPLLRRVLRGAARVGAVSTYTAGLVRALGVADEAISIMPPGIDPAPFARSRDTSALTGLHDLDGKKVILTHGRLDARKGHDVVIRALPRILAEEPDAVYLITGAGESEGALRRLVAECAMERHVVFGGRVAAGDLPAVYQVADVFVMLSRQIGASVEGFGIVCLEAAASGCPVIAGRSGGTADAVEDGVTGLLIDPTDEAAVAGAVLRLLRDPDLARRMGNAGRERVMTRFDRRAFARRVHDLSQLAIRGSGARSG